MTIHSNSYRSLGFNKHTILAFLVMIVLSFTASVYAHAATTTVNCRGKQTDRALIQKYINKAAPGDTINLAGTCQLDGTAIFINTSNLTIQGAGASGNWSTVLLGLTDSNGVPLNDQPGPTFQYFNHGISIGPSNNTISGVAIQGIKFKNLNWPVDISPSIAGNTHLCSGITITTGNASHISVTDNWFDNDGLAVSNFGVGDHINIENNLITNMGVLTNSDAGLGAFDISVVGQLNLCSNSDNSISFAAVGTTSFLNITNNTIKNDKSRLPFFILANSAVITNNNITAGPNINGSLGMDNIVGATVMDLGIANSVIIGNIINGIGLTSPAIQIDYPFVPFNQPTTSFLALNTIINSAPFTGVGISVDSSVSGATMIGNLFNNISSTDYLLCDANANTNATAAANCYPNGSGSSFNNTIVSTNPNTTVMNLGTNNTIQGPYINVP